jgi:DNA-binding response OmpR family regulator
MKFLVVDDTATMRRNVTNSLQRIGCSDTVEAGVNNYIVKPFTPQVLKEKIDALLPAAAA